MYNIKPQMKKRNKYIIIFLLECSIYNVLELNGFVNEKIKI